MGSTNEVISLGLEYTNVIFSGSIIFISVVALNSLLHAEGDTKTFRNVLILSFILNIFLNPLFIFGYGFIPALGMTGIGVATIISQTIAFLILLIKFKAFNLFLSLFKSVVGLLVNSNKSCTLTKLF